jgi:hypothetical protein
VRERLLGTAIACAILVACAAAEKTGAPSTTVPRDVAPSTQAQPADAPPSAATRDRAKSEIKHAEIELTQAGNDCTRACKALASMERATAHLCTVVSTPDEQQSCEDARQKLQSSRDRVRTTCGECTH